MLSTVSIEYSLAVLVRISPMLGRAVLHSFDISEWLCGSYIIGLQQHPMPMALHLQASTQLSLSPFRRGETDQLLKQATTQRGNGQWNSSELCAPSDCMVHAIAAALAKSWTYLELQVSTCSSWCSRWNSRLACSWGKLLGPTVATRCDHFPVWAPCMVSHRTLS